MKVDFYVGVADADRRKVTADELLEDSLLWAKVLGRRSTVSGPAKGEN